MVPYPAPHATLRDAAFRVAKTMFSRSNMPHFAHQYAALQKVISMVSLRDGIHNSFPNNYASYSERTKSSIFAHSIEISVYFYGLATYLNCSHDDIVFNFYWRHSTNTREMTSAKKIGQILKNCGAKWWTVGKNEYL